MKAVFDHGKDTAKNIKTFWFIPETNLEFDAGQYLRWYLPHPSPDQRGERRYFTISSSPSELPLISLTTKFAVQKSSSLKKKLIDIKPGDELDFTGPFGDFVLPKDKTIPLVFVAGGIGVTPFRSIIKWLLDNNEKREIQLLYAVNSREEIAFNDVFETFGIKPSFILAQPEPGWQGEAGRLDGERIIKLTGGPKNKLFYISGPEPMVQSLSKSLATAGVAKDRIIIDEFPGYNAI